MRRAILVAVVMGLAAAPATMAAGSPSASSPTVTTGAATAVSASAATLHGVVNPQGLPTRYAFQYGPTSAYGRETQISSAGSGTKPLAVLAAIKGLTAGTPYHYRIIAISSGGVATGADQAFKTTGSPPPTPPAKPIVATGSATAVGVAAATVAGTVDPNGAATTYYFEFGTTTAYGAQTKPLSAGAGTKVNPVAATLTGLAPNQSYHYRLDALNAGGAALGADATFRTMMPPPTGSTLRLFGRRGFVSSGGFVSVFIGCFGQTSCSGSITVTGHGRTLGRVGSFRLASESADILSVRLNKRGRALLKHGHHPRVQISVISPTGQTISRVLTLFAY